MARQLQRDIIPKLDSCDVKLFLVSIGTPKRGIEFSDLTGFPQERLIADPENALYASLGLYTGLSTFFSVDTPMSLLRRFRKDGAKDLVAALKSWKPYIPPKLDQAYQEGGCIIFNGKNCVLRHYDTGPGDHIDLDLVISTVCEDIIDGNP